MPEPKSKKILETRKELLKKFKKSKPKFRRQNWFQYSRLKQAWRKPRGRQSKFRKGKACRPKKVSIGYSTPRIIKNLHPTGYEEILVRNESELSKVNPETQAARFMGSIGRRKRESMIEKAKELGVKVLNP